MSGSVRGPERRRALVAAAAALLAEGGPDAVTHRAVAARSGLPLAATTYWAQGRSDLLVAAAEQVADDELAQVRARAVAVPRRARGDAATADVVLDVLLGPHDDAALQARYERLLAAGRHPELRPALARARVGLDDALDDVLRRCGRQPSCLDLLVAVVDGAVLSALVEGDGRCRPAARAALLALLPLLPDGGSEG